MLGRLIVRKRGNRDEGEKPFWISFADLMTALMVLFLVALSVALNDAQKETERARQAETEARRAEVALKAEQEKLEEALRELKRLERDRDKRREVRQADIASCHEQLENLAADFNDNADQGVRFDRARNVIDFGSRARFNISSHELTEQQARILRDFTEGFLSVIQKQESLCQKWLKRVVVEGFTDKTGSYLLNLNLSLNRSQRVMCVLLSGEYGGRGSITSSSMSPAHAAMIQQLFLVGGYSSNSLRATDDESRRIELRIEFYQVDELKSRPPDAGGSIGRCSIGRPS